MLKQINKILPNYGYLTFTSFILCALSGMLLAFAYNPTQAEESIGLLLLQNPAAAFIRSLHYWSAQMFFILSIVHIIDHLIKSGGLKLKRTIWIRTVLLIPLIIYAMLSGFFLRGDSESSQAINILDSILNSIPLIGEIVSYSLIGTGDSLIVIFLHHIVTTTVLIWLFSSEHSKVYYSDRKSYLWVVPILFVLAFLFIPGLGSPSDPLIKSPWYFIGLQEFLHLVNLPILTIILFLFFLFIVHTYPTLKTRKRSTALILIILCSTYIVFSLIGLLFRGEYWSWGFEKRNINSQMNYSNFINYLGTPDSLQGKIRSIKGRPEGCLSCHEGVSGLTDSHSPDSIGCSSCHLGNSYTFNKELAHEGMILLAGNLSSSRRTCGSMGCHIGITERIESNIMNTMSGVISVDKWIFGETSHLNQYFDVKELGHTPADNHLRGLCAGCHIGKEKSEPHPIDELSRGGGCTACHLSYSKEAENELKDWKNNRRIKTKFHPSISINIDNGACFGCHSRSGRISTNYEGWHETLYTMTDYYSFSDKSNYRLLDDGRVFQKMPEDVHHSSGLVCIDCHNSYELMGNGIKYKHKEEQVKTECRDCHFTSKPKTITIEKMDAESRKLIKLRNLFKTGRNYIVQNRSMTPLINVYLLEDGTAVMKSKNGDSVYSLKKPVPECSSNIPGHNRLACQSCHTKWAAQCISCHTEYNENEQGWDNLTEKKTNGAWLETSMDFRTDAPALGVISKKDFEGNHYEEITTFVPGMIMTLKQSKNANSSFHRLYAPAFTHTISRESRDCKSCHSNPAALGYGRGKLLFSVKNGKGSLNFVSDETLSKYDNLPIDAWIGYLSFRNNSTTRSFTRPFSIVEQKRILNVGACLECHDPKERRMVKLFKNFKDYKSKLSRKCLLPFE